MSDDSSEPGGAERILGLPALPLPCWRARPRRVRLSPGSAEGHEPSAFFGIRPCARSPSLRSG